MYLIIIKVIYDKPIANIMLYDEDLIAFPLRSRTTQWCPLLPLLFNTVLEVLEASISEERNIKKLVIVSFKAGSWNTVYVDMHYISVQDLFFSFFDFFIPHLFLSDFVID